MGIIFTLVVSIIFIVLVAGFLIWAFCDFIKICPVVGSLAALMMVTGILALITIPIYFPNFAQGDLTCTQK